MLAALGGGKPALSAIGRREGAQVDTSDADDLSPEKRAQLQRQVDEIQRSKGHRS